MSNLYSKSDFPELNEYTDFILAMIEHHEDYILKELNGKIESNHSLCKSMFFTLVEENDKLQKKVVELEERLTALEGRK